jgi:glycosyltransferase involved in cell wall biosynthesis
MHILVLASGHPNFGHFQSYNTVLAMLLDYLAGHGHAPILMTANFPPDAGDPATRKALEDAGVTFGPDFGHLLFEDRPSKPEIIRRLLLPRQDDDFPRFRDPDAVVAAIEASGAQAVLLFWDTWFESLLPRLRTLPVYGYWAKPRFASLQTLLENAPEPPTLYGKLSHRLALWDVAHKRRRHYALARRLHAMSNICFLDTTTYRDMGIPCNYIPNTWRDSFGASYRALREAQKAQNGPGFRILGSIGQLTATGNLYGIGYWSRHILPILEKRLAGQPWSINVCGRNVEQLPPDIQGRLESEHVVKKGFVPELDDEMLGNDVFLMCNNAGPYMGAYTRVIYAMAAGLCLIGHTNLARSMIELESGRNALLGSSPEEIAEHVVRVHEHPELAVDIGRAARQTYESHYHPDMVFQKIVAMLEDN